MLQHFKPYKEHKMAEPIIVVPYQAEWSLQFHRIGSVIRQALGSTAIRIDHIGSTAVPGLAAKPIIDIQVSVQHLEPMELYRPFLQQIGYIHRVSNPDLTKRYFREIPGSSRKHIHVRAHGSWAEQFALLFRDYLREHPEDCEYYAQTKYALIELFGNEREKYVEEKEPIIWEIMKRASKWSQGTGWTPQHTGICKRDHLVEFIISGGDIMNLLIKEAESDEMKIVHNVMRKSFQRI